MNDYYSLTERKVWMKHETEKMHQLSSHTASDIGPVEILMTVLAATIIGYIAYIN